MAFLSYRPNETHLAATLWSTFGTDPFMAIAIREQIPSLNAPSLGPRLRRLVNMGFLAGRPDGSVLRNGTRKTVYTFTPAGILTVKRHLGEAAPVCAELSNRGRLSSVRKFFRDTCIHCGRSTAHAASWFAVGTMMLPVCPRCGRRIRRGDPEYWGTCLASLIRTKHGGKWRLEGDEVVSRCGPAPADP